MNRAQKWQHTTGILTATIGVILSAQAATGQMPAPKTSDPTKTMENRAMDITSGRWLGNAIAYSGYRAGQSPDTGVHPSRSEIAEDLRILQKNWKLIRIYGSGTYGEDILRVIRQQKLPLKAMLGAWLGKEPGNESNNARQIDACIRLANAYKDIVIAVNVGNEVFVNWTAHPVPEESMVRYIKKVKEAVAVPVTVADNYAWWASEDGVRIAGLVDFVTIHTYPMWERRDIDDALSYTIANYESVKKVMPPQTVIVIGEAGWATYTEGHHHVYRAGDEAKQQRYYRELTAWAKKNNVNTFFFEAFDEPWKGTGTEGHWGLFTADRKAKPAMQTLYPELMPDGPTSPSYSDAPPSAHGPQLAIAFHADFVKKIGTGVTVPFGKAATAAVVQAPVPVADGDAALQLTHDGSDWGGVYFHFDKPFDARSYQRIVVDLRIPDKVVDLELKLEGPAGNPRSVNVLKHRTAGDTGGWETFAVPLAAFAGIDVSKLTIIGLWNPKNAEGAAGSYVQGDILIDGIRFE